VNRVRSVAIDIATLIALTIIIGLAFVAATRGASDPDTSLTDPVLPGVSLPAVQVADRSPDGGTPHPPAATDSLARPVASEGPKSGLTTPMPGAQIGEPLSVARGWATWYRDPKRSGYYGAVNSFRWGDDQYIVQVCAPKYHACTHVRIVDFCACGDRHGIATVIDLSPAAFRELAPLGRGVIRVEVSGPITKLPATDSEEIP
jgi:Lytic transglycolase